jgi:hypothetical protein
MYSKIVIKQAYRWSLWLNLHCHNAIRKVKFILPLTQKKSPPLIKFLDPPLNERTFSRLKLIKNHLRSKMFDDRLMNLILCSSEKDLLDSLNLDELVTVWGTKKERLLQISWSLYIHVDIHRFSILFFSLKILFHLYLRWINWKLVVIFCLWWNLLI